MKDDITPREERRGTRHIMVAGAVIAAIALAVAIGWPLMHKTVTGQQQQGPAEQIKK